MNANFIYGKMTIKAGRKIIATIIYRPEFFKGTKVTWNEKYPYSLQINGMQAECETYEDATKLLYSEIEQVQHTKILPARPKILQGLAGKIFNNK